jgi:hypothetical protein
MKNYLGYSALLLLLGLPFARAAEPSLGELTTVSSIVNNSYQREKLPDGSLKPVRYAFGEGTCDPGRTADASLNHLKFDKLAVLLSAPLARLGYQPCREVNNIDQLLMVHWGRTIGWDSAGYGDAYGNLNSTYSLMKGVFPTPIPVDRGAAAAQRSLGQKPSGSAPSAPSAERGDSNEMEYRLLMIKLQEEARNRENARKALMLGYYDTLKHIPTYFGDLVAPRREQLMQELEDDRYYVIVVAYDFQTTRKSRQPKVLWITRFSLQTHGNDFDRSIERMIRTASPYFGRSSNGLLHEQLREGQVDLGDLKVLEYEEPKK